MGQQYALKLLLEQPHEVKTEDVSDEALRARLQFHVDCSGQSTLDICERIGGVWGAKAIRNFLEEKADTYSNIDLRNEGLRRKLTSYLQRYEDPTLALENPLFCETSIALKMGAVCGCCKQDSDLGIIVGASGLGKTEFLKELKRRDRNALVVTADPTARSLGAILLLISKLIPGVSRESRTNSAFLQAIIEHLRGSKRLLVIDEAHFLSWEAFETVRKIYDSTGIGLVFVGQQFLYDQMKGGSRKSLLWDQIFSRVGMRCHFKGEIPMEDVEMIVGKIYSPGLDKRSLEYLHARANGPGKFRSMVKLLQRAQRLAEADGVKINSPLLQEVNKLLMM